MNNNKNDGNNDHAGGFRSTFFFDFIPVARLVFFRSHAVKIDCTNYRTWYDEGTAEVRTKEQAPDTQI